MGIIRRLKLWMNALRDLGIHQVGDYLLYQFGMVIGHYRRTLYAAERRYGELGEFTPIFEPANLTQLKQLFPDKFPEADLILSGFFRPYGAHIAQLRFPIPNPPVDWTEWKLPYAQSGRDVKDIWEPARFGWAVSLARAYQAVGDERYAELFWQQFELFDKNNRAYYGPNWRSAQEAGIRIIHFCVCASIFKHSPASYTTRKKQLSRVLALHALRIPPTMVYARAQHNNHLLSEAAGLFTAGACLPDHPLSASWMETGWREFESGLIDQIDDDGTYTQQSTCYHRLMLTLALWMNSIRGNRQFSEPALIKLAKATLWLRHLGKDLNGLVPNLGSNDGSRLLPLFDEAIDGYQQVMDAASAAFLGEQPNDHPNELTAWLVNQPAGNHLDQDTFSTKSMLRMQSKESIAFLRTARFTARPAHADQLHLDLWWQGENILRDAGSFRYNCPSPWANALAGTDVHNTVTIDDHDQMTRASKFLWEDWAQAEVIEDNRAAGNSFGQLTARHDGYSHLGLAHERKVEWSGDDRWTIIDRILPISNSNKNHLFRLQWLLPDAEEGSPSPVWSWMLDDSGLKLKKGKRQVSMEFRINNGSAHPEICLFRAGDALLGKRKVKPIWGWYSNTYAAISPALSVVIYAQGPAPMELTTTISLRLTDEG